ncbi:hypothetical protein [uncultured Ferrimonas sp.]|uniref:hypothetical protein n=1 Tax=uncultured Ferrimonas sp. TaxID=432640 RepID=UPI00260BC190|nr:hypothetical protein [uncultured Ferrimonas sp.]
MKRIILLLCLPAIAWAKVPLQERDSLLSLLGQWRGTMEYIDHGSGTMQQQPLQLTVSSTNDQTTLIVHREFIDPAMPVDTLTIRTLAQPAQVAYVRNGRMKSFESRTTVMQVLNPNSWILVQEHSDVESNRPITIRHTLRRSGDRLTNTKEIDFKDDKRALWQLRYRSAYQRINADSELEKPAPFMLAPQRRGDAETLLPVL